MRRGGHAETEAKQGGAGDVQERPVSHRDSFEIMPIDKPADRIRLNGRQFVTVTDERKGFTNGRAWREMKRL